MSWAKYLIPGAGPILLASDAATGNLGDSGKKSSLAPLEPPAIPTILAPAPKTEDAAAQAKAQQDQQRRILLNTGGQTSYTGPFGAPILAGQTSAPTLLGG